MQAKNDVIQSVEVEIDAASINTNDEKRDGHLRSADFFDAERYPSIIFKSTNVEHNGNEYRITGDLTMHGQTHPVTFTAEVGEPITDPYGLTRAGANVKVKSTVPSGASSGIRCSRRAVFWSEEIKFDFDIQATAQQPQPA